MSRRIRVDTSNWGTFDPTNVQDAICERERRAFTQYTLARLRKSPKTGADEQAILVGAVMAIAQLVYAMHDNAPPDTARDALHDSFDLAWLQCAGMARTKGEAN